MKLLNPFKLLELKMNHGDSLVDYHGFIAKSIMLNGSFSFFIFLS